MRKKFIAGNWKMFTDSITAELVAAAVVKGVGNETRAQVAVCPPFPYLARVFQAVRDTPVALGAQNLYPAKEGAFTGEVSPAWTAPWSAARVSRQRTSWRSSARPFEARLLSPTGAVLR